MNFLKGPKALVLGCTGQDGSYISKSLLRQGFTVIGTSRRKLQEDESNFDINIKSKIKIIQNNLLNKETLQEIIESEQPDEIYNLAAQSSVGLSFKFPIETKESIEVITKNILNTCRDLKYKGRLFFAGSSEMFGDTAEPANANSQLNPISPYAEAKANSYLLVKKYRNEFGLKCATGIFFNHESKLRPKNFVTQKIIKSAKSIANGNKETLKLGNISIVRDWGLANDYVHAAQKIIRNPKLEDYTICTGKSVSLEYFINNVFKKLNLKWQSHVEIDENLFRKNEIKKSYGDPIPLLNETGWKAKHNIDDLIDELLKD